MNATKLTRDYTYRVRPIENGFLAYSQEMGVSSKGETVAVAVSALRAAIEATKR
jgi:predicted RNase H-like HicB family nuclease